VELVYPIFEHIEPTKACYASCALCAGSEAIFSLNRATARVVTVAPARP
jgi:hypothetical protein